MGEPFGTDPANEDPSHSGRKFSLNLRYAGQYFDQESGLFHNGHRDYSPQLGRYIESDPIGLAGGINTYTYVGGNPVGRTDETGLCPFCPFIWPAIQVGLSGLTGWEIGQGINSVIDGFTNMSDANAALNQQIQNSITNQNYFNVNNAQNAQQQQNYGAGQIVNGSGALLDPIVSKIPEGATSCNY